MCDEITFGVKNIELMPDNDNSSKTMAFISSKEGEIRKVSVLAFKQSKSLKDVIEQFDGSEVIPTAVPIKYLDIIIEYLNDTEDIPEDILNNILCLRECSFPSRYEKYVSYEPNDVVELIKYSDMLGINYLTELIAKHFAREVENLGIEMWCERYNIINDLTEEDKIQLDKEEYFGEIMSNLTD